MTENHGLTCRVDDTSQHGVSVSTMSCILIVVYIWFEEISTKYLHIFWKKNYLETDKMSQPGWNLGR